MNNLTDDQYKEFVLFYRTEHEKETNGNWFEDEPINDRNDYYEDHWEDAAELAYKFHEYLKQKGL